MWIHEQLSHNGIRHLIPDERVRNMLFKKIVTDIGRKKILLDIDLEGGGGYEDLPDHLLGSEYLAFISEKKLINEKLTPTQDNFWSKVKNVINNMLNKVFKEDYSINDNDLTRIVKASALSVMNPNLKTDKSIPSEILFHKQQYTLTGEKKES